MQKISKRTQVLMHIFEFQRDNSLGIKFNDLVERCGLERSTVSKCHDSLSDMGILEDVMIKHDGYINDVYHKELYSKAIRINKHSWEFVEMIYNDLVGNMNEDI